MSPRTSMSTSSSRFNWGGPSSESESDSPIPHQSWSFIKSSRIISMNPIAATKGNWMSEWIGLGGKIKGMKVNAKSRARIREKERLIAGTVAGRRARSQSVLGSKFLARTMVFLPEETWGIIAFLLCFAAFATVMTLTLKHVLNPDKEPLPWRSYCQSPHPTLYSLQDPNSLSSTTKRPGPHTSTKLSINSFAPNSANQVLFPFVPDYTMQPAEEFNPVGVLIGVFTTDEGVERRNMIRQSYGSHPRSRRLGTEGVRIKFVMGRPRRKYQKAIQLEMEGGCSSVVGEVRKADDCFATAFNDILLLDMPENMNSGKTHAFFSWAAENATIPDWEYPLMLKDLDDPVVQNPIYRGERRPEYVVKADEDSFIMLGELERRLRVVPRTKSYWGYLVKNTFMAGECYALSFDLVQYIAASPALRTLTRGKEDKLVSRWMKMHPERENIVWVAEKCWIYDHPKAGTV
ncbi:hypothetical protein P7C73_g6468, partial [Tremellales sp. Uapishka_1]